jgi:Ser/Thr protein kinase RdoA (MazF antagonist)
LLLEYIIQPVNFEYLGLLPDSTIEQAVREYGITEPWVVLPFLNIEGRGIAVNRRSETARKAIIKTDSELLLLKEIPWYCSNLPFVKYELNLQEELRSAGLPIPPIRRTPRNDMFITMIRDSSEKFLFMQPFILGKSWNKSPQKTFNSGKELASLHLASQTSSCAFDRDAPRGNIFDLAVRMIDVGKVEIADKKETIRPDDIHILNSYVNYALERVESCRRVSVDRGYEALCIPVHGDYNPWNLIFREEDEKVNAILDFDNTIIDNPVHDLAEALAEFSYFTFRHQKTRYEGVPDKIEEAIFLDFLRGYADVAPQLINMVKLYLSEAFCVIAIELFTLGIVRGDYEFRDCIPFIGSNTVSLNVVNRIIQELI